MSFKPQFQVVNDDQWYDNAERYALPEEAERSAFARFNRWTQATAWRAVESKDPVNYRWIDGKGGEPWSLADQLAGLEKRRQEDADA